MLTAHGYGHGAQTAAVVNALRRRRPDITLRLRTTLPEEFLRRRFAGDFVIEAVDSDVGMHMNSAVDVRLEDSALAYERFHQDWDARVTREAGRLRAAPPDLVLSNIAYLPLAAAARAGIRAVAMCSLNWADIYTHYFSARPEAARIEQEMRAAYRAAEMFLRLEPGMPMSDLANSITIGPVATVGQDRRAEIFRKLGLAPDTRLVMLSTGGIELRLPVERWPAASNIHWLVPAAWTVRRAGFSDMEALGLPFTDVLRGCDAIIGKPGYGTFAEAGCNAVPMLYVPRGDWPEAPYLIEWLAQHGRTRAIDIEALTRGDVEVDLQALWSLAAPPATEPRGIKQAVALLDDALAQASRSASSVPARRQ